MTQEAVIIMVGSGMRSYREYLLRGAAERHPIWLLEAAEPTWQRRYIAGWETVPLLDTKRLIPDREGLRCAASHIALERPVAGVFTHDETLVTATAQIAEDLGLPGLTVEGADQCRNKHRSRSALTEAGIPQPRFALATSHAEAERAATTIGYPLVLKPRGMGASIGVVRVNEPAEFDAAFQTAWTACFQGSKAYEGGILVEELLDGPEISVDGAARPGEYRPFFVAAKRVGPEPYFEEIGHTVRAEDPLLYDPPLVDMLVAAHRALDVGYGVTHTEIKLTRRGPVIVEINARLGGDLIPYLGLLVSGLDPAHVAVDLATGVVPSLEFSRNACAGIRFCYPDRDGVVSEVRLPEPGSSPGLVEARPLAAPGTLLRLPPRANLGRYGYLICESDDPAQCDVHLDEAEKAALVALSRDTP